ncbi:L-rhamnose mutarotase [Microbacterium sp. NPDC090218]
MKRICQVVSLDPERREEYLWLHAHVWPEIEDRLSSAGIANYSIFNLDDLLIAYYEYEGDDHDRDIAAIADHEPSRRWWALTSACQRPLPDAAEGELWSSAREVWHLA